MTNNRDHRILYFKSYNQSEKGWAYTRVQKYSIYPSEPCSNVYIVYSWDRAINGYEFTREGIEAYTENRLEEIKKDARNNKRIIQKEFDEALQACIHRYHNCKFKGENKK